MTQPLSDILTTNGLQAIRVNTNDLHPAIKKGWGAVVESDGAAMAGDYVLIKFSSGQRAIRLLVEVEQGGYWLEPVTGGEKVFVARQSLESEAIAIAAILPPSGLTNVSRKIH